VNRAAVLGVDGWRGGWVGARLSGETVTWHASPSIRDLVDDTGPVAPQAIGIDMPIGLVDRGAREADALARERLVGAASRVFPVPPRPVLLEAGHLSPDRLQKLSRRVWGRGTSVFSLALGPRILELDAVLSLDPTLAATTVEVHPELSFAAMGHGSALPSKKTAAGVSARLTTLTRALGVDVVGVLRDAPQRVPVDDCLDALAAAWSARRWLRGEAVSYPDPAPTDSAGLRMAIVV
jgi:predicted RNase H-like nuclease